MAARRRLRNIHRKLRLACVVIAKVRRCDSDDLAASYLFCCKFGVAEKSSQLGILVNGPQSG
jgi:hypothetical protein